MMATRVLRFILAVSAITMLVQAAFAGRMLAGDVKSAVLHAFTAKVLVLLGGSQVLAALVLFLQRRCPLWVPAAALGLVTAEVAEFAAGHLHHVAIHVPLGLAIFGGAIRQLVWAIGSTARRSSVRSWVPSARSSAALDNMPSYSGAQPGAIPGSALHSGVLFPSPKRFMKGKFRSVNE